MPAAAHQLCLCAFGRGSHDPQPYSTSSNLVNPLSSLIPFFFFFFFLVPVPTSTLANHPGSSYQPTPLENAHRNSVEATSSLECNFTEIPFSYQDHHKCTKVQPFKPIRSCTRGPGYFLHFLNLFRESSSSSSSSVPRLILELDLGNLTIGRSRS